MHDEAKRRAEAVCRGRAVQAGQALEAYGLRWTVPKGDLEIELIEEKLRDLLTDLHHFSERYSKGGAGVDLKALAEEALENYRRETAFRLSPPADPGSP